MIFKKKLKKKLENPFKENTRLIFSMNDFFRLYLRAIKDRALYFLYPVLITEETVKLLKYLEKNFHIAGYMLHPTENKVQIFLKSQGKPLIPKIRYYSSQGRTRIASLKFLAKFKKSYPQNLVLIRTQMGLFDLQDCLDNHCGGEMLVSFH